MTTNYDCILTEHGESNFSNAFEGPAFNLRPSSVNIRSFTTNLTGRAELNHLTLAAALSESFEPLDSLEYRAEKSKPFFLNKKVTIMAEKQVKQRNQKIEVNIF